MNVLVVYQGTGYHGWSSAEVYAHGARQLGLSTHVCAPRAPWGAPEPETDDGLCDALGAMQAGDAVLLCGFDWHSQPLHQSPRVRSALLGCKAHRVGLFQEHLSAAWIRNDPALEAQFRHALDSSVPVLSHVVCNHEEDLAYLRSLGVDIPTIFLPFAADESVFRRVKSFESRAPDAFFRGKLAKLLDSDPYAQRSRLIEATRALPGFVYGALSDQAFLDRQQLISDYVSDLNAHALQLNLPSLSRSLTCRPFEVMACGGLLVQSEISGDYSQRILPASAYVAYQANDPDSLVEAVAHWLGRLDAAAERAERGHSLVAQLHTGRVRVGQMLRWVEAPHKATQIMNELVSEDTNATSVSVADRRYDEQPPKLLVDLVFFQYANTGIARIWRQLLEQWASTALGAQVILGVRAGSQHALPDALLAKYQSVELPAHAYEPADADQRMLDAWCRRLQVSAFASTYYTWTTSCPNVLLLHDFIPERLDPSCMTEAMWREKHSAIRNAAACICISETTAQDLAQWFPDVVARARTYVSTNAISTGIAAVNGEELQAFRDRYRLPDRFLLFVGERRGYLGYKNVEAVLQALESLVARGELRRQDWGLVFVGGAAYDDNLTIEPALERRLYGWTIRRLDLDDRGLSAAYTAAHCLIYPSLHEGFGLPPFEAFKCGTPSVVVRNDINRELLGDGAVYAASASAEDLAVALRQAMATDRDQLRRTVLSRDEQLQRHLRQGRHQAAEILEIALLHASLAHRHSQPWLDAHPDQLGLWASRLADAHIARWSDRRLPAGDPGGEVRATCIVSVYKGDRFIRHCIEDLIEQSLFRQGRAEIVIIDSASPGHEYGLIADLIRTHRNIFYFRTPNRETLYRAWNRGAWLARGDCVTNCNVDDRHRADFLERLVTFLDEHPDIQLVYPQQLIGFEANQRFVHHQPERNWGWPPYTLAQLKIGNHVGSQPMWRRSVHERIGGFRDHYTCAGDYEFWLRIATRVGPLALYPVPIGLYYFNPTGIEHGDPVASHREMSEICRDYGIPMNYEISEADRRRNEAVAEAGRDFSDLQYKGIALQNRLLVCIVDAPGRTAEATIRTALDIEGQTIFSDHRLALCHVGVADPQVDAYLALAPSRHQFPSLTAMSEEDLSGGAVLVEAGARLSTGALREAVATLYQSQVEAVELVREGHCVAVAVRSLRMVADAAAPLDPGAPWRQRLAEQGLPVQVLPA